MPVRALKMLINRSGVGAALGKIPGVRAAYKNLVWRHPHFVKSYYGSYATFAEAAAQAPKQWAVGWDNSSAYFSELEQPSFYASLYWLARVLKPGDTLVDFGGHYGGAYISYTAREHFPDGAQWIVVDVPTVIKSALGTVATTPCSPLSFTADLTSIPHIDVFFSAGSIQYVDRDVAGIAAMITERKPRHIILNNFALTSRPGFWSLQHLGAAMAPNQIFNERAFIGAFEEAGYTLRDRWEVAELNCQVPFEPHRYVKAYSGVHFERDG